MISGLILWLIPMINEVVPTYGFFGGETISPALAQWMPAIGSALISVPIVFVITIAVSLATEEPPLETKKIVRQCHSPEPMSQQQTAEDVVTTDGGETPADD
jgi:cation/acetate symporter